MVCKLVWYIILGLLVTRGSARIYISEISEGKSTQTEYCELYNSDSSQVDLSGFKLIRVDPRSNLKKSVFDIGVDGKGDLIIPARGFLIITRGSSKEIFEESFGTLAAKVTFNEGKKSLFFASKTAWRWRLRSNDGDENKDNGSLVDDTLGEAGGNGYKSVQITSGKFIRVKSNNGATATPGALDDGQQLK